MVRPGKDRNIFSKENHLGGEGQITVRELILSPEELCGKGRVFAHSTLEPGASIGYHIHQGDAELYYIYSGQGEFNDNGTLKPVQAGDVTFTWSGEGHSLKNTGTQPLEFIAVILYS